MCEIKKLAMLYIYIIIVLVSIVYSLRIKVDAKVMYIMCFIIFIISLFFYGSRSLNSTPDTINYLDYISGYGRSKIELGAQILFDLINKMFYGRSDTFVLSFIFVLTTTIFLFSYYLFFNGNIQLVLLAYALSMLSYEYFDLYANILRNGLAISLFFLGFSIYIKKGDGPFCHLLMIISIFFHGSMLLVYISFLFVVKILIKNKKLYNWLFIGILVGLFIIIFFPEVFNGSHVVLEYLFNYLARYNVDFFYRLYSTGKMSIDLFGEKSIAETSLLFRSVFCFTSLIMIYTIKINRKNEFFGIVGGVFMILLLIYIIFSGIPYHNRLKYLSFVYIPILLSYSIYLNNKTKNIILIYSIVMIFVFVARILSIKYTWVF
jgi:hypothetical protein